MVMVQEKAPETSDEVDLDRALDPLMVVRIEGKSYDMVRVTALSLRVRARLRWLFERLQELEKIPHDKGTAEDDTEYADRYRECARIALPTVPDEVWGKVDDEQAQLLASRFFVKAEMIAPQFEALMQLATRFGIRAPLATPSPSSNGSTAPSPKAGSTRQRRS